MDKAVFYLQEAAAIYAQWGYAAAVQYLFARLLACDIDQATYTQGLTCLEEKSHV